MGFLERTFHLKENHTSAKTEILAGLTTFTAMAYILAVNPQILSVSGMNPTAIMVATALASFFGCVLMGLLANYPFALAPGLGINAYFAYTICLSMGYSYKLALLAVFVEGLIFVVLTVTNIREMLVRSMPACLKTAIATGIGMFVAFIGLQGSKLIVADASTLVTLNSFRDNFSTSGISSVLCLVGIMIVAVLVRRNVKAAVLIGVLATWLLGIGAQLCGLYVVTPESGYYSLIPTFSGFHISTSLQHFGSCFDFASMRFNIIDLLIIIFSLLYMDMFDTMGTLIGVSVHSGMLDEHGHLPKMKQAMLTDAIATSVGAVLGTSTTTTFVESSAGVAAGGRTGLTAIVTGLLFLVSIVLAPVFTAIPSFATAPALIYVGYLMMSNVHKINFKDICEALPAFICIMVMTLSYSISDGIAFGVISYTVMNLLSGKRGEKVSPMLIILSVIFLVKYIVL